MSPFKSAISAFKVAKSVLVTILEMILSTFVLSTATSYLMADISAFDVLTSIFSSDMSRLM